ncbi:MAG: leucine-rich repeat domain-containing protein, partial [Verrucomicrobia bacterium]|nr:leucine-rich repeat domain-containing protein [Verrucomicrobiota bacterium]
NGVAVIWDDAFYFCAGLTSLSLPPSLTTIGNGSFEYCYALTNLVIPGSVTSMGSDAFHFCRGLKNLVISEGATSIGVNAFGACTNLSTVTISGSVNNLGDDAFAFCPNLKSIYCEGNAPTVGGSTFIFDSATVYYLPGTTGWAASLGGLPTALWAPQMQGGDGQPGARTNRFGFNINWASGQTVVVEACTNLFNPVWQPVQTNTLTTGSGYFSDPQWANYPGRFYRLRSP